MQKRPKALKTTANLTTFDFSVYPQNISACTHIVRLNSTTTGVYLRSLCAIDEANTYDVSNITCLRRGMKLFIIDTKEIHDSFSKFIHFH